MTAPAYLEIKAELANLRLTCYSPYALAFAGVQLDGGQLDAATEVKTARGNLQGEVRLEIDQLALQPLQEADAERAAGTIGVPWQTAVELVADAD